MVGDGAHLAIMANARFDLETSLRYAEALAPYGVGWYEEPVAALDVDALAAVSRATRVPLATGENLFSMPDARNLIRYGGMEPERDYLQFDAVLSYGLVEYLRTLAMLKEHKWSVSRRIPRGARARRKLILPRVFQPFGDLDDDVTVQNGRVRMPDAPGIGIELNSALHAIFRSIASG